jgi:hypothetical protein
MTPNASRCLEAAVGTNMVSAWFRVDMVLLAAADTPISAQVTAPAESLLPWRMSSAPAIGAVVSRPTPLLAVGLSCRERRVRATLPARSRYRRNRAGAGNICRD